MLRPRLVCRGVAQAVGAREGSQHASIIDDLKGTSRLGLLVAGAAATLGVIYG